MCRPAACNLCHKKSWWGCGRHVPGVMDRVPEAERCTCEPKIEREGKIYPPTSDAKPKTAAPRGTDDEEKKGAREEIEGTPKEGGVGHAVRGVIDSLSNLAKWQNLGAR